MGLLYLQPYYYGLNTIYLVKSLGNNADYYNLQYILYKFYTKLKFLFILLQYLLQHCTAVVDVVNIVCESKQKLMIIMIFF